MFRNRRSSSMPPVHSRFSQPQPPPPTAAAAAAAQAFANQQSAANAALSAAAAAAALRSLTSTPVPISEIQTKRMIRRGSVSSINSNTGSIRQALGGRPNLQRRGSSASMTERTFRSPSPGPKTFAPNSVLNSPGLVAAATSTSTPLRKRASSVEPGPRVQSPEPPRVNNVRGVSVDRANTVTKRPARAGSLAPLPERIEEHHMEDKLAQLPPGARAAAAIGTPKMRRVSNQASPATTRQAQMSVPQNGMSALQTQTTAASQKPMVKKTRKTAEGSHLANGTMGPPGPKGGAVRVTSAAQAANAAAAVTATPIAAATVASPAKRVTSIAPPPAARPPSQQGSRPPSQASQRPASRLASNGFPPDQPRSVSQASARPHATRLGSDGFAIQPTATPSAGARPVPARQSSLQTSSASQDQIKTFQNRASAMLARPRSPDPVIPPTPMARQRSATDVNETARPATTERQSSYLSNRAVSQPATFLAPTNVARGGSVSPSRGTRFSEVPVAENVRHDPPSRALSPFKSALKGTVDSRPITPSGSTRPTTANESEVEDAAVPSANKKKKAVKVSFGEAPPLPADATTSFKRPSGPGAAAEYQKALAVTDEDTGMSPRPALPFFGSVRSKKDPSANKSITTGVNNLPTAVSEPVLGSGGFNSGSLNIPAGPSLSALTDLTSATGTSTTGSHIGAANLSNLAADSSAAPIISVQPASPHMAEATEGSNFAQDVDRALAGNATQETLYNLHGSVHSVPDGNLHEHEINRILAAISGADSQQHVHGEMLPVHNWNYSEQVEHEHIHGTHAVDGVSMAAAQTEEEGGEPEGFASLNAILESPAAEGDVHAAVESLTTREVHPEPVGRPVEPQSSTTEEDWDRVRAYWSSLSEQRKQQLEQEAYVATEGLPAEAGRNAQAAPSMPASSGLSSAPITPKKTKKKVQLQGAPAAAAVAAAVAPLPPWPDQQYQQAVKPAGAAKPLALKSSMRGARERASSEAALGNKPAVSMRSSMRNSSDSHTMNIRGAPPPQRIPNQGAPPMMKTSNLTQPMTVSTKPKPQLTRIASNSSDGSESSFKKRRRGNSNVSETGRYSMKRTMRASSVPPQATYQGRATSPQPMRPGSRFSLRAPSPSPSLLNRNLRPGKTRTASQTANQPSRFDESSDEEDMGAITRPFQSRLADSDDDEPSSPVQGKKKLFGGFGPVRGNSNRADAVNGGSPDVFGGGGVVGDSALAGGLTRQESEVGSLTPQKSSRNFFGLGKKRDSETPGSPSVGSPPVTPGKSSRGGFLQRFSSASSSPARQPHPPIDNSVPVPAIPAEYRAPANGVATAARERPALGTKTEKPAGKLQRPPIVSRKSGKEKRFQGLRRVFGLND